MTIEDHLTICINLRTKVMNARAEVARLEIEAHIADRDFEEAAVDRLDGKREVSGYLTHPASRDIWKVTVGADSFDYEKVDSL